MPFHVQNASSIPRSSLRAPPHKTPIGEARPKMSITLNASRNRRKTRNAEIPRADAIIDLCKRTTKIIVRNSGFEIYEGFQYGNLKKISRNAL